MGPLLSKKHGLQGSWCITPYEHDRLSTYLEENDLRALVAYKHHNYGGGYGVYTFSDDPKNDDPIIWFELKEDAELALDDEACYNDLMGIKLVEVIDNEAHPLWGIM